MTTGGVISFRQRNWQLPLNATTKDDDVRDRVDQKNRAAQHPLELARKRSWIEDGQQVVLDEAGGVERPTTLPAKPVLEGREWAEPAGELDPRAPGRCREMYPSHPRPSRDEEATEQHEDNEHEMQNNRAVGKDAEGHDGSHVAQRDVRTVAPICYRCLTQSSAVAIQRSV